MKSVFKVVAVLCLAGISDTSPASAQAITVAGAMAKCERVLDLENVNYMSGFIDAGWCAGFAQAVAIYERRSCSGPIPAAEALAQAFVNWSKQNPQFWGGRPSEGMATAFAQVFPCK